MSDSQGKQERATRAGGVPGFFTIDRRTWRLLCGCGDINQAVSYLAIASGTGQGNRTSKWSALAVETHTGLNRATRAKEAIDRLIGGGFLRLADNSPRGPRTKPIYEIQPFETAHKAALDAVSSAEGSDLIRRATTGDDWGEQDDDERNVVPYLLQGLLWRHCGSAPYVLHPDCDPEGRPNADLIWLPNSLVQGVDGKDSPIKRLRSTNNLWALRLLVDLYHVQNLSADSGISRRLLCQPYTRKECGVRGRHIVLGFSKESPRARLSSATEAFWDAATLSGKRASSDDRLWKALDDLMNMKLLTCVPHLVENSSLDCEWLHGFGSKGIGEDVERELAEAANRAAGRILGESTVTTEKLFGRADFVVPVLDSQTEVQMVGIYRLTYRPHTLPTQEWLRRLAETEDYLCTYARMQPASAKAISSAAAD